MANNEAIDSQDMLPEFLGDDRQRLQYMIEEAKDLAIQANQWKYIQPPKKIRSNVENAISPLL